MTQWILVACMLARTHAALLKIKELDRARRHLRGGTPTDEKLPAVHFAYTTGCNDYQLTHSVVLDHSWLTSGNTGRLTRIVANCHDEDGRAMMAHSPLRDDSRFSVFFADEFDMTSTGKKYPARSRPHALTQWLESEPMAEPVVGLLDPDFVFLRSVSDYPGLKNVTRGRMISPSGWWGPGAREYQTGPLWLLSSDDLKTILPRWLTLTDDVAKKKDDLMREQFAFQQSAQEHHIPADFDPQLSTAGPLSTTIDGLYALHYYASYNYKEWKFHKALATTGWYADHFNNTVPPPIQCGAPLFQEPPPIEKNGPMQMVMVGTLIPRMNKALQAFREVYCPEDKVAFAKDGLKAFGLMRTNHPIHCAHGPAGTTTRYLVESGDSPVTWDTNRPLGGKQCSRSAQMWQQPSY